MGNIISSILQDGRQRKKWLDHNFIVLSVGSNKRTRHSKIIDLTSNTFPAHVKVCLPSQLNRYRCLHTFLSAMITLPNLLPFLLPPNHLSLCSSQDFPALPQSWYWVWSFTILTQAVLYTMCRLTVPFTLSEMQHSLPLFLKFYLALHFH